MQEDVSVDESKVHMHPDHRVINARHDYLIRHNILCHN